MCSFAQPRVSEELSDWQNVFAIPRFRFFEVLFHISYYCWAKKTRSLYRGLRYIGSLYRGSTVHMPTPPPSHLHNFEHRYLHFARSINIGAFVSWGRGGGQDKQRSHLYSDMYLLSWALFPC